MVMYADVCKQLLGLYLIIALAFLVYPDDATDVPDKVLGAVKAMVGY